MSSAPIETRSGSSDSFGTAGIVVGTTAVVVETLFFIGAASVDQPDMGLIVVMMDGLLGLAVAVLGGLGAVALGIGSLASRRPLSRRAVAAVGIGMCASLEAVVVAAIAWFGGAL
jgi:hypothetical protein